jgi:hypothetical protein
MAITDETEAALESLEGCPGPCDDGTVKITLSSGHTKKFLCAFIDSSCPYGERMASGLERCITGVMSGIGVPLRHLENFKEYRESLVITEVIRWPTRGFLIFAGDTGTGKSFGAAWAVREYLKSKVADPFEHKTWENAERAGRSVMWCSAMEIADDRDIAARAKREFLAVIDDLGGKAIPRQGWPHCAA